MDFKVMGMDKAILRGWVVKVLKLDIPSGRVCGRFLSFIYKYLTLKNEGMSSRYWPYACGMFSAD